MLGQMIHILARLKVQQNSQFALGTNNYFKSEAKGATFRPPKATKNKHNVIALKLTRWKHLSTVASQQHVRLSGQDSIGGFATVDFNNETHPV